MNIDIKPFKNKVIELEIRLEREEWDWFNFRFSLTRKRDHAGLYMGLELLGFVVNLDTYDIRHWDYDNNKWKVYSPNQKEEYYENST